jgi:hypothetical protein
VSHNDRIYGEFITVAVPHIEQADRMWLGNQMGKIYKKGHGHRHKYRLCMADRTGEATVSYKARAANDSMGRVDKKLINPQTGNVFWFGFNVKGKRHVKRNA